MACPAPDDSRRNTTKWCGWCDTRKSLSQFGTNASQREGLAQYCKDCFRQISRDRYRKIRAQAGARVRESRPTEPGWRWCPDCAEVRPEIDFPRNATTSSGRGTDCEPHHNKRGRESTERRGGSRDYHLLRRYGIGAGEVADLIGHQGGVCPICVRPLGPPHHVDHDHATGEVRGFLCFTCSGGRGNYGDAVRLRRAADYLDRTLAAPSRIAPGVYDVAGLGWRRPSAPAAEQAGRPAPDRVAG